MSLGELLQAQNNDLTSHDLGVLARWASEKKKTNLDRNWKAAYALIREGADTLLRQRALSQTHIKLKVDK